MWHTGTGTIVYDPYRGNLKKKPHWWCVVELDREITRLFRWWIVKELHVKELKQPSWDAHISVIRGEKPTPELMHLWKKYDGEEVEFKYKQHPRQSGDTTGGDRPDNGIGEWRRKRVVLVDERRHGGIGNDACLRVRHVVDGHDGHVLGLPIQCHVDIGEQTAPGVGHCHPLAVDLADKLVVGVPGNDQVDGIVQQRDDLCDRPGQSGAAVVLSAVGKPTLVEQDHDRLDVRLL